MLPADRPVPPVYRDRFRTSEMVQGVQNRPARSYGLAYGGQAIPAFAGTSFAHAVCRSEYDSVQRTTACAKIAPGAVTGSDALQGRFLHTLRAPSGSARVSRSGSSRRR